MTIHIIDETPDLYLTRDEYHRLMTEYGQAFMHYAGTPPSFESWARQRKGDVVTSRAVTLG